MINISSELKTLLKNSKKALIKIKCGNLIFGVDDETDSQKPVNKNNIVSFEAKIGINNNDYPLGTSCSNCITVGLWDVPKEVVLRGQKTEAFVGYIHDGYIEWIPLGVFYPEKPVKRDRITSFTAYDKMYELSFPYAAGISGQQTPYAVLQDMARIGGFELDSSVEDVLADTFVNVGDSEVEYISWGTFNVSLLSGTDKDENGNTVNSAYNINDGIGYIAGFVGANAQFDRYGKLRLFRFNQAYAEDGEPFTVTENQAKNIIVSEEDHVINFIYCNTGADEFCTPENTVTSVTTGVKINNPLFTSQEELDKVFSIISNEGKPFSYRPIQMCCLACNPAIEPCDILRFKDRFGNTYAMPAFDLTYTYDGSMICDLKACAQSVQENNLTGVIISRQLTPFVQKNIRPLAQRIADATESIAKVTGGYVALIDTDGDGIADNFYAGEHPVDLSPGSDWRTKGRCVRINMNGIAVSTKGADGPFIDFAVYFDKTLNKYLINASDIATGTLSGIRVEAEQGKIGSFVIDDGTITHKGGLFADYVGSVMKYRVFIQPAYYDSDTKTAADTWVFSTQRTTVEEDSYDGTFIVYANGKVDFNNTATFNDVATFNNSAILNSDKGITYPDGSNIINPYSNNGIKIGNCFYLAKNEWTFPGIDSSGVKRDTIDSTGGFVLCANGGNNAMYFQASSFYLKGGGIEYAGAIGINANGKIVHIDSSALRFKENVKTELDDELNPEKLYDLPIKQFNFKDEYKDNVIKGDTQIGFIADDVLEIYPNAALIDSNGNVSGWNAHIIIPAMLKLIQDQKKQLDKQESQINDLSEEIKRLENLL